MIDIHSHILPYIDDGPQTIEEAIAMAKAALYEGITKIIATPHHKNGSYRNPKSHIVERVTEFNKALMERGIPLTVLAGQETRIHGDILKDYEDGELLTLAESGYVFIELPSNHVPRYTEQLLYDMQVKGLFPIIVHPERNGEIIENPELLYQFVKKGALTQTTAASVCGLFGKKIKKFALEAIGANLTHFIASDAHNTKNRSFHLRDAYEVIKKEFGREQVYVFQENAELVVDGKTIYRDVPERIKKKKFLGIF